MLSIWSKIYKDDIKVQRIIQTIFLAYNNTSRIHRMMMVILTVITFFAAIFRPFIYYFKHEHNVKNMALATHQFQAMPLKGSKAIDIYSSISDDELPQDDVTQKDTDAESTHEYIISSGDTLSSILTQYNIEMSDIALLTKKHNDFRNLKIGQQLSWIINDSGALQQLRWEVSRRETRIFNRIGSSFKESHQWQQGTWYNSIISGRLSGSFISSTYEAGLSRTEIDAIIKAFQWQLDFKKLSHDDSFSVLISHEYFDSKKIQSQLLAVRIRSGRKDYYAIRAEDGKFYDQYGASLGRGFMRFPTIKQFRISSNFNLHRVHPLTGRIVPHKGIDFAMPIDTPVVAVSDGEVLIAKYSGSAGYYMAVRHGRQYTTRYMHLKNLLVKPGQKVKCGELIALSGNSGRTTGPHLHFELWINQEAVNPLTVKLPNAKNLIGKERRMYLSKIKAVMSQLQFN